MSVFATDILDFTKREDSNNRHLALRSLLIERAEALHAEIGAEHALSARESPDFLPKCLLTQPYIYHPISQKLFDRF